MKTCPYCGKKYPDDATVCAIDGQSLSEPAAGRKKVSGIWRGVYGYGPREKQPGFGPVAFTLRLKQGWTAHFAGSVTEDAPQGMPGTGTIDGYFQHPSFEFTKQMPVGYVIKEDGTQITLRERLAEQGHPLQHELRSAPILYQGTFLDANRVQGTWILQPLRIPLPDRSTYATSGGSGYWCAEFITEDLKANPSGRPAAPLFDKSLLSSREVDDVEKAPLCSLGKFSVTDAEKYIERLVQAGILCRYNQDDSATPESMPIMEVTGGYAGTAPVMELLVNPDDEARAREIIGGDSQV